MSSVAAAYLYASEQKTRKSSSAHSGRSSASMDTPRVSAEAPIASYTPSSSNSLKNAVRKIVDAAREHHGSVNNAFDVVYGTSYYAPQPGVKGKGRYAFKN